MGTEGKNAGNRIQNSEFRSQNTAVAGQMLDYPLASQSRFVKRVSPNGMALKFCSSCFLNSDY
jgi:hypothetical protein